MLTPGTEVRWWLLWAAIPYGIASELRARLYRWGWLPQRRLPVFVVSVGNLTVGGTGKTPVVIRLADWLLSAGKRVAILSRGYRRASYAPMLLVSNGERLLATADEAGDEPYLMARRCPKAIVAVGADRYELGRWVLDQFQVDCVLLDDGFQHLRLHRDVNLLLVDATDVDGLRAIVPAGRLREFVGAAARATMIIVTRADDPARVEEVVGRLGDGIRHLPRPAQVVFRAEGLVSVTSDVQQPSQWCKGKTAVLCSGIGHAASFRALAETLELRILDEVIHTDHHRYGKDDIAGLRARAIELRAELLITTEKDAAKLAALLGSADTNWWAIRLEPVVTVGEEQLQRLIMDGAAMGTTEVCA